MNFTREDILKIKLALDSYAIKDSELQEADFPMQYYDTISIVLNGANKKISIKEFIWQVGLLAKDGIFNVTDIFNKSNITLNEAILTIPYSNRKEGLVITFLDENEEWRLYQFRGSINQFNNESLWKDLYNFDEYIVDSILPDEEDLTKELIDDKGNYVTKFKDKKYNPKSFSGMATKILRKHIIEIDDPELGKIRKNILYLNDFDLENCIYTIKYNFDLNNLKISIPRDSILCFEGGLLQNGIIYGNSTKLVGNVLLDNIEFLNYFNTINNTDWYINTDDFVIFKNSFSTNGIIFNKDIVLTTIPYAFNISHNFYLYGNNHILLIALNPDEWPIYNSLWANMLEGEYRRLMFINVPNIKVVIDKILYRNCYEDYGVGLKRSDGILYNFIDGLIADITISDSYFNSSNGLLSYNSSRYKNEDVYNNIIRINNNTVIGSYFLLEVTGDEFRHMDIYLNNNNFIYYNYTKKLVGPLSINSKLNTNLFATNNIIKTYGLGSIETYKLSKIYSINNLLVNTLWGSSSNVDSKKGTLYSIKDTYLMEDPEPLFGLVFYCGGYDTVYFIGCTIVDNRTISGGSIAFRYIKHLFIRGCNFALILKNIRPYSAATEVDEISSDMNVDVTTLNKTTFGYSPIGHFIFDDLGIPYVMRKDKRIYVEYDGAEAGIARSGETSNRPKSYSHINNGNIGFLYYDTTLNKLLLWTGNTWIDVNGNNPDKATSGTTVNRPKDVLEGFEYYDSTLKKKILWNGTSWVNIDGTSLE